MAFESVKMAPSNDGASTSQDEQPLPLSTARWKFLVLGISALGLCCFVGAVALSEIQEADFAGLSQRDLARAKKVVPGPAFQAAHAGVSNELLNKHLRRLTSGKAVPCEDLSMDQVATTVRELRALSHPGLAKIYAANVHPILKDNWKDPRGIEGAYVSERALQELPEQYVQEAMKEKACYDAAMAFTHSLPDTDKRHYLQRVDLKIPLLPTRSAEETRNFLEMGMPTSPSPILAANHHRRLGDAVFGERVFNANCAACHAGGQNGVVPDHTLEKEALEKFLNGGFNEKAIETQVTNGKGAMPAFGGRLADDDIANVATYALQTSEEGWD